MLSNGEGRYQCAGKMCRIEACDRSSGLTSFVLGPACDPKPPYFYCALENVILYFKGPYFVMRLLETF
jgi:hypothetical protein